LHSCFLEDVNSFSDENVTFSFNAAESESESECSCSSEHDSFSVFDVVCVSFESSGTNSPSMGTTFITGSACLECFSFCSSKDKRSVSLDNCSTLSLIFVRAEFISETCSVVGSETVFDKFEKESSFSPEKDSSAFSVLVSKSVSFISSSSKVESDSSTFLSCSFSPSISLVDSELTFCIIRFESESLFTML